MRKLRRMISIAYGRVKVKFIKQLVQGLKEQSAKNKNEEEEMFLQYIEHCVIFIQKSWRGYHQRKWVIPNKVRFNFSYRNILKLVQGWKIRKILTECREIINIKRSIAEIENSMRQSI